LKRKGISATPFGTSVFTWAAANGVLDQLEALLRRVEGVKKTKESGIYARRRFRPTPSPHPLLEGAVLRSQKGDEADLLV